MASWAANLAELFGDVHEGETLTAAGGPYYAKAQVAGLNNLGLQWVGPVPSGPTLATVAWYSSLLKPDDPRLKDLDPATNPEWYLEAALVFASNPGETRATEVLTIDHNPYGSLLAVVTVLADITDFSLRVRGQ